MSESISDFFADALTRLCPDERVRAIEAGADPAALWAEVDALGFTDAMLPEARGGAGLSLAQAAPLFVAAGRCGLPQPFGDTVVARALLASTGQQVPSGCIALAEARPGDGEPIDCAEVPGGALAQHVLLSQPGEWLLLPVAQATTRPGSYRPRGSVSLRWASARQASCRWSDGGASARAFLNAVQASTMAGAMERVLALTVSYANDRRQFGRPIGQFQAIQQELAAMAEQAGSAAFAARLGCHAAGSQPAPLLAATAKLRASEAALRVAQGAHAVFGAIGITEEHVLGVFTTRLHEWRATGGTELACAQEIGQAVCQGDLSFAGFVQAWLAPVVVAEAD
jgi:alkylation response protein AidB-like acyl-CoA dehydrogenase